MTMQMLQRKSAGPAASGQAPSAVHRVLSSPGKPLDAASRGFFESRFGYDFSRVRVHADSQAAESARAVNAEAYTVGRHLVFDEGKYQTQSPRGRELLAHELTHTIQQRHATFPAGPLAIASQTDPGEREAERAASSLSYRRPISLAEGRPVAIQRQPNPGAPTPRLDLGRSLAENASPFMAASLGSVTIDGFETGKAEISPANQAKLGRTADLMKTLLGKYPGSTVRVIGHTDAVGKESDNQTLGQSRADSVQAALVGLGIDAQSIQTESKGETQLLVKTQNAEARNRRVEVRFQPQTRQFGGPMPGLTLNPPGGPSGQDAPKPDLRLPPDHKLPPQGPGPRNPPTSPPLPDWFWKPLPPGRPRPGFSLEGGIESIAKKITSFLPKSVQKQAQDLVKDAIEKGITSGLDSALQSAGVDQNGRQAIGKAVEAAIKQKIGGSQ
jgi:outer membrane protein OmpA-like peptidoglycan-associated protein